MMARIAAISPRRLSHACCSKGGGDPASLFSFVDTGEVLRKAVSASCSQRSIIVYEETMNSVLAYARHRRGRERSTEGESCSSQRLSIAWSLLPQMRG